MRKVINMNSLQYELPRLKQLLKNGDEIIIKESNKPIAIISPVKKERLIPKQKDSRENKSGLPYGSYESTASEIWFG